MPVRIGSDTILVLRAPLLRDPRGGQYRRDWSAATSVVIKGCSVQKTQVISTEELRHREFAQGATVIFAPPTAPEILHTDQIIFDMRLYTVSGHPFLWKTLWGRKHHWEIMALRQEESVVTPLPPAGGALTTSWSIVVSGHGPPTGAIPGSNMYVDVDTGQYWVWTP